MRVDMYSDEETYVRLWEWFVT